MASSSTTTTTQQKSAPVPIAPSSSLHLSGLGLWYGARTFDQHSWDQACRQAHEWGMSIVHPKLADGPNLWYDGPGLSMIKEVADTYSLRVVPYHFCYGNAAGSSAVREASICALLGNMYGGVSPDMEDKWFHQEQWATDFGKVVREHFSGGVFPTIYANVTSKPEPYIQMSVWSNGFLPQCYFSVWSSFTRHGQRMTAQEAVAYLAPQWATLNSQVLAAIGRPLPAIYPIISTDNGLPADEVSSWLSRMGGYHYCGFWYDVPYGPYAQTVLHHLASVTGWPSPPLPPHPTPPAPVPAPVPVVTSPTHPPVLDGASADAHAPFIQPVAAPLPPTTATLSTPTLLSTPVVSPPPATTSDVAPTKILPGLSGEEVSAAPSSPPFHLPMAAPELVYPHLDEAMTRFLWSMHLPDMAWNPTSAIQETWMALLAYRSDIWLGSPIEQETSGTIEGEHATWITFESGRRLIYFPRMGSTVLF